MLKQHATAFFVCNKNAIIGHGVGNQEAKGVRITWDEAEPGDLAVYSDNSHICIVTGRDAD